MLRIGVSESEWMYSEIIFFHLYIEILIVSISVLVVLKYPELSSIRDCSLIEHKNC